MEPCGFHNSNATRLGNSMLLFETYSILQRGADPLTRRGFQPVYQLALGDQGESRAQESCSAPPLYW